MGESMSTSLTSTATVLLGEKREKLLHAISEGHSFKRACRLTDVSYDTFRWWMLKGSDPDSHSSRVCPQDIQVEPYWTFARDVRRAESLGKRHSPPGPRHGRLPSPISPEAQTVILDGLSRGWSYHDVSRAADVRLSTFLSWLRLGGYPRRLQMVRPLDPAFITEPYKSFVLAVIAAEETYLVQPR